jgi:hypothetical protein
MAVVSVRRKININYEYFGNKDNKHKKKMFNLIIDEQLELPEETDPEDRPTLENILPLKNIWHGWSVVAGLVSVSCPV